MDQSPGETMRFVLSVDRDRLSCAVTIPPGSVEDHPSANALKKAIESNNILPRFIDLDAIDDLLAAAADNPAAEHAAVVARGRPPEHGEHAAFILSPDLRARFDAIEERAARLRDIPRNDDQQADESEDAIDFRSLSAFVVVNAGDELGTVREATLGVEGEDLYGNTIPAKHGHSLTIVMDETVRVADGVVTAEIDGLLRAQVDRLLIEPELSLKGDVDFRTGNIDFPGNVTIKGGIKDRFVVRAKGIIQIDRLIEAAEIRGLADVHFKQGMAGRGLGRVAIAGSLYAGYLDGISGVIRRDCIVAREIKECRIRVERRVKSPECTVYGGRLEAVQHAELGVVGGPGGVETEIAVGCVREIESLVRRLLSVRNSLDVQRERTRGELDTLGLQTGALTEAQTNRLESLRMMHARADAQAAQVTQAAARLLDSLGEWSTPSLVVQRAIYKGAKITLRGVTLIIRDMVQGPIKLDLDIHGQPRCFMRDSNEPTPIAKIAMVEEEGEQADPILTLRELANKAA